MIQMIATDIDGTLLDTNRSLSERTISTFKDFAHIPVILISARMPSAMYYLQEMLDRKEMPIVCYNGALVKWHDEVLLDISIDYSQVEQLVHIGQKHELHVSLYRDDQWFVPQLDYWANREINNTRVHPTVQPVATTLNYLKETAHRGGAHKVMYMGDATAMDAAYGEALRFRESVINNDPNHTTYQQYRSKDTYTEISPNGISKKSALEQLLKLKFKDLSLQDVAAFGDNYNDIDMISAVGYGVAVGNAREELKAVASHITTHHKEDGVAVWLSNHAK